MVVSFASAQIRHAEGIQAVEVSVLSSSTENGSSLGYGVAYSKFFTGKFYAKAGVYMENGQDNLRNLSYSAYMLDITANFTLFNIGSSVFVNAGVGLNATMDKLNEAPETIKSTGGFNYGPLAGSDIEIYFTDNVVLLVQYQFKYMIQKDFGNIRSFVGGGLKYAF